MVELATQLAKIRTEFGGDKRAAIAKLEDQLFKLNVSLTNMLAEMDEISAAIVRLTGEPHALPVKK